MIHHRSLGELSTLTTLDAQRVHTKERLGRFAPRIGVPPLSRTSRRLRVQWPVGITVLCPWRNQLRTAGMLAWDIRLGGHMLPPPIKTTPPWYARRRGRVCIIDFVPGGGKGRRYKNPPPGLRHSAKEKEPNAQGIGGAGGQVHPAVVWRSLRHVCGAHASQRHTLSGDRFTPRCPVLQERPNGPRPFGHATILTQFFGSWGYTFLSGPDYLPQGARNAAALALSIHSRTPLRVPLPITCETASSTPAR